MTESKCPASSRLTVQKCDNIATGHVLSVNKDQRHILSTDLISARTPLPSLGPSVHTDPPLVDFVLQNFNAVHQQCKKQKETLQKLILGSIINSNME